MTSAASPDRSAIPVDQPADLTGRPMRCPIPNDGRIRADVLFFVFFICLSLVFLVLASLGQLFPAHEICLLITRTIVSTNGPVQWQLSRLVDYHHSFYSCDARSSCTYLLL